MHNRRTKDGRDGRVQPGDGQCIMGYVPMIYNYSYLDVKGLLPSINVTPRKVQVAKVAFLLFGMSYLVQKGLKIY